jgi:Ketol-acid reductoisomerase
MAKMYYTEDAKKEMITGKKVSIIGYGSQGHSHAQNLKDSGIDVTIGLYEGSKSKAKAEAAGLKVMNTAEAVKNADITMILVNDETQAQLYATDIAPNLKKAQHLHLHMALIFTMVRLFLLLM